MNPNSLFAWFRKIAWIEGVSYLLLVFIAMPLKYWFDQPQWVRIVGSAHGALFVAFLILALLVMIKYKRNLVWGIKAFISSLLPFGTFYMEKFWKKEEEEFVAQQVNAK